MSYYYSEVEWNSDYDSTWEDEELEPPKEKKTKSKYQRNYGNRAARDMQNYRHGYGQTETYQVHQDYMPNLEFYQNKIAFEPCGVTIEEFHRDWREDYEELEENHGFIQWLFPLRERGVNPRALPLTLAELKVMKADDDVRRRLLESYKLMLGFYGIQLLNEETGEVSRAENYKERFRNLNNHSHNNLRITRILKCLGEMGFEHLQAPLVRFFLEETLCNNNLPSVARSALDYFMFTVKDKQERRELVQFAWVNYKSQEQFIWGPVEKLRNFENVRKKLGDKVTAEKQEDEENQSLKQDEAAEGGDVAHQDNAPYAAWKPNHDVLPKHELGESLGEAASNDGGPGVVSGRPHDEVLQRNETGEVLEEAGVDNGGPEVDKLEAHDNVHPREALEREDVISNSRKENQTTESKSTGNEQTITKDKSTGNEQKITEDKSTVNEPKITEDNSTENEQKITEDNSTENEQKITEDNSTENEQKITEDNSTDNELTITKNKTTVNEQKIPGDKSTVNEQKITGDKSTVNEQKITEDKSTVNEQKITEDKSTVNEQKITKNETTGNEQKITEGKCSGHGQQKTEVNGLGDQQTKVYNSSGTKQTTENTRFINHKHSIEDAENMKLITEGPSIKNENMTTGVTRLENAKLLTQSGQPKSPKNAEEQRLLSGPGDKEEDPPGGLIVSDQIISPSVCCCFTCLITRYT